MTGRNDLAAAWRAVLNAAVAPIVAYEWDKAPRKGADYLLVSVTRSFGGSERNDRTFADTRWTLTVGAVGSTVFNVGALLQKATEAVEYESVAVGGVVTTAARFESESDPQADDDDQNIFYAARTFTFAL